MPTIEDVWRTDAGARLFNGIAAMQLVNRDGFPVLFSKRRELTDHVIGLMLEAGYLPEDMTPRVAARDRHGMR